MENIKYKEITTKEIASDFYHTWQEVFTYISDNKKDFYIWHKFFNSKLQLEPSFQNYKMCIRFTPIGYLSDDLNEEIYTIKYKRLKTNADTNTPDFKIIYSDDKKVINNKFYDLSISNNVQLNIRRHYWSGNDEHHINMIEKLFLNSTLNDRKKIIKTIKNWQTKKEKNSAVLFWKIINEIFKIEFVMDYRLDSSLHKSQYISTYNINIEIDTREHYNMVKKCKENADKKMEAIRQEKIRLRNLNI